MQTEVSSLAVGQIQDSLVNEVQSHYDGQSTNTSNNDCWSSPQTVPCILRFFPNRPYKPAAKRPLVFGCGAVWSIIRSHLRYYWQYDVRVSCDPCCPR